MQVIGLEKIRPLLDKAAIIDAVHEAFILQARGDVIITDDHK